MIVYLLPLLGQNLGHPSQDMGGQMTNLNPGRDKKSCIIRDEVNIVPTRLCRPSDKPVPAANVTGCRGPRHTGDGPFLPIDNIFEMFAHRLAVA